MYLLGYWSIRLGVLDFGFKKILGCGNIILGIESDLKNSTNLTFLTSLKCIFIGKKNKIADFIDCAIYTRLIGLNTENLYITKRLQCYWISVDLRSWKYTSRQCQKLTIKIRLNSNWCVPATRQIRKTSYNFSLKQTIFRNIWCVTVTKVCDRNNKGHKFSAYTYMYDVTYYTRVMIAWQSSLNIVKFEFQKNHLYYQTPVYLHQYTHTCMLKARSYEFLVTMLDHTTKQTRN